VTDKGKTYLLALGIVAVAFLSLPGIAQAISPSVPHKSPGQQSRGSRRSILVDAEMVLVDVTVTRADGSSVMGLEKGAFRLTA
jgi:hypothetical protein